VESPTKERKGINPFTKEPTIFKAKPARNVIKGRPVKAVKDAVAYGMLPRVWMSPRRLAGVALHVQVAFELCT
jgi:hypothetical protein